MTLLEEAEKQQSHFGIENEMKRTKKCSKMIISNDLLLQVIKLKISYKIFHQQVIIFSGTLAKHSIEMADQVKNKLLPLIITLLNSMVILRTLPPFYILEYYNENEIVLQCCFVFIYLLSHCEIANKLCENERIVEMLLNLLHNDDNRIRNLASKALERISVFLFFNFMKNFN